MNITDQFYLAFKNQTPCWPLIASASAFGFVGLFGITMNLSVIYVTLKTKSLRGTANFLLALTSVFELFHQSGHFLFVYTAFSGLNFIEYRLAIHLSILSLFGLFGLNLSMFFTGLDRFICVIFPTKCKSIKLVPYLSFMTLICILVPSYITVLFYFGAEIIATIPITGTIGDLLKGSGGAFYTKYGLILNSLTISIYVITGIILRKKSVTNSTTADLLNKRLFRSLSIIISVNIGGYFVVAMFLVFLAPRMDPVSMWFIRTILGVLCLNVSASSNAPILYLTSSEYRKAFRVRFRGLFLVLGLGTNSIIPSGTMFKENPTQIARTVMRTRLAGT